MRRRSAWSWTPGRIGETDGLFRCEPQISGRCPTGGRWQRDGAGRSGGAAEAICAVGRAGGGAAEKRRLFPGCGLCQKTAQGAVLAPMCPHPGGNGVLHPSGGVGGACGRCGDLPGPCAKAQSKKKKEKDAPANEMTGAKKVCYSAVRGRRAERTAPRRMPTTAGRTQPSFTSARGMLFKRASRPNRGIFRSCKVYRILATVVKAMPTG